jgi:hypothetical protein
MYFEKIKFDNFSFIIFNSYLEVLINISTLRGNNLVVLYNLCHLYIIEIVIPLMQVLYMLLQVSGYNKNV